MRILRCLITGLVVLLVFLPVKAAARDPAVQQSIAEWTVLVYLDADNNLEREAVDDFIEMASVGSSSEVNIVVQFDRIPGYDNRYGDWTGAKRFLVQQGMTPEPGNALSDLGEVNMGSPQTLSGFLTWGMAAYPARHTAAIIWNHGDGWRRASLLKEPRKAIAWDDTNGRESLDMAELGDVLAQVTNGGVNPIDLLAFDACLMAMVEIDVQISPYVRVRTASEETEPGTGYPFDTILADLRAHPLWDATELGESIVARYYEAYKGETHSAVDLGAGYGALVDAIDQFAGALIANQDALLSTIGAVRQETQQFQMHYVDLYDLAQRIFQAAQVPAVRQAAQAVMTAADAVLLAEQHGNYWPGANGITVYFPARPTAWDSAYDGDSDYLSFTANTRWDDFLISYLQLTAGCEPDSYEPDDDYATATTTQVNGGPQSHSFCPENDTADWISFSATGGRNYQISTAQLQSYADTLIKLYGSDGKTLLGQDDDGGAGWASQINWTSPADGIYYVEVIEYFGRTGSDTGYVLRVDSDTPSCAPDAYEPDDDPSTAAVVQIDATPQVHNFCAPGDVVDWYRFMAVQGRAYTIETSALEANSDTVLSLYDRDSMSLLLTDDDSGSEGRASRVEWRAPASGSYYARVHNSGGMTGSGTGYRFSVEMLSPTVRGTARLQGRSVHSGVQIVAQPGGATATTAADGAFSIAVTVPSTISAGCAGYLPVQWAVPVPPDPVLTFDPVMLLGGDANGDRTINILDIVYIGANLGRADPQADLNADGMVDILDIVIAAGNFGESS
ncbi:MAG: clostripain-related cysteine peptidase [Anaerolineae bacterium]